MFNNEKTYYNGVVVEYFDQCNVDELSMIEVESMVRKYGFDLKLIRFYMSQIGINCCRDLVLIQIDVDACSLRFVVDNNQSVGVFVDKLNGDEEESGENEVNENQEIDEIDDSKNEEGDGQYQEKEFH